MRTRCRRRSPPRARTASATAAPDVGRCHVVDARRKAIDSDIVIVNHHLLLADLALKEDGFGDLLGAADAVIIDEAHQIPDLATQFFGTRFGSRQAELLVRDARAELAQARASAGAAAAELGAVEQRLAALNDILRATSRPDWQAADTPLADAAAGTGARTARAGRGSERSKPRARASRSAPGARPSSRRGSKRSCTPRNTKARAAWSSRSAAFR